MKSILLIATALLVLSCASDTEQKSLDEIAALYNGKTSYSKSFNSNIGQESRKTFNIRISNSKLIDSLQPTVTTANIAMLVYEGLTTEEKGNYTHIDVELINAKNDTAGYFYPIASLKTLSHKSQNFKRFSESIINKDYEAFDQLKDANELPDTYAEKLEQKIAFLESKKGSLLRYQPFGIAEFKNKEGLGAYQFQSFFVFENGRIPYVANVQTKEGMDKIVSLRFFDN